MKIAKGGWSHIFIGLLVTGLGLFSLYHRFFLAGVLLVLGGILLAVFMVYFFRDPERNLPKDASVIFSGADGWVRSVERIFEARHLKLNTIRISVYLTPWDVHVNRVPLGGTVIGLDYTPGKHILTRNPQSSEVNEHSTILIQSPAFTYMVRQIVGPLVRRVKYWLTLDQEVASGERLGIMKFGSRLDIYLPAEEIIPLVKSGDRVFAGITEIARIAKGS